VRLSEAGLDGVRLGTAMVGGPVFPGAEGVTAGAVDILVHRALVVDDLGRSPELL